MTGKWRRRKSVSSKKDDRGIRGFVVNQFVANFFTVLCGMMMTACDVSAIAKPWEVQHKIAKMVADEFFDQGDLEKLQLNTQPIAMMDRERKDELPKMQVGFIDVICMPLYRVLSETFPWIKPLYEGTLDNRQHWQDLAEKVEMGLTWIDHDTIEKPVEDFAASTEEIEFTVTTLNCQHNDEQQANADKKKVGVFTRGLRSCMSLYTSHKGSPVRATASTITPVKSSSASKGSSEERSQQTGPTSEKTCRSDSASSNSNQNGGGAGGPGGGGDGDKVKKNKKKSKLCLLL